MNIKSLLLGSAAALAAVSGAQAADAIIAAEPEPMEYVRVCDAFGTGYFYIPGTETCLKIGGYVRFQTNFGRDESGTSDWDSFTRAQLDLNTKNDTEFGTLEGAISLRGNADQNGSAGEFVDAAYIAIAGFKAGYYYSWWDNDLSGETDTLSGPVTNWNAVSYTYDGGAFTAGISVDELEGLSNDYTIRDIDNSIGVAAQVTAALGGVRFYLLGGYDTDLEEGAVRAILEAEVGPGTLSVAGVYSSNPTNYFNTSEWTVAAQYAFKATDKLTITPAAQYFDGLRDGLRSYGNDDGWVAGVTVGYQITEGLRSLATVNYADFDNNSDEEVTGFLRLQRDF